MTLTHILPCKPPAQQHQHINQCSWMLGVPLHLPIGPTLHKSNLKFRPRNSSLTLKVPPIDLRLCLFEDTPDVSVCIEMVRNTLREVPPPTPVQGSLRNCGVSRTMKTEKSKLVSPVMRTGWQDMPAECSLKVLEKTINLSF